jgi:PAS domain S-box-containing protein
MHPVREDLVPMNAQRPLGVLLDPHVVRGLNRFVTFTALFSVAVGLLGLVGWLFHIAMLKSVIPGRVVIKPSTTLCFVLIGFALWLLRKKDNLPLPRVRERWGQALAAVSGLAGLLNLTEYMVGWDSGIDQMLFPGTAAAATGPGLLDPITALDFVLLGLALLLLDWAVAWRSRRYWPARFFAFVAGIIAIVGVLDFILGSRFSYTHVALQSAVTLFLLSLGLLCARTEQGLGALLASSTIGGALTRRLLPAAVTIPIVIGVLGWRAFFAGLYSEWSGVSVMIVVSISLLAGFTIWNGYRVDRSDAERRSAEAIIHQREEELREAQRLAQVGSWWWSPSSDSGAWSEQFCRIAGRDPKLPPPSYKEHCGFYTAESAVRFNAAVQKAIRTGTPYELDLEMVRTDGAIRSVTSRGEVESDGDGQVVLVRGTVQDVTERKRAESEIKLLARLQSVVAELGQRALRSSQAGEVLDEAVALVAQNLDVEYCKVLELLPDGKALLLRSGVGWKEGFVGSATVGSGADSQAGYTVLSDQPVTVEDLRTEKRFSGPPLLHEHGVVSGMSVIIPTSEGPYGVLGAHTKRRRIFTKDEVNFLQAVANVLGMMIQRQRADEALHRSTDEIRDLYNHAPCGYHSLDKDGILVQINDTELSWLGYTREELIGKIKFSDLLTPECGKNFQQNFLQFKEEGAIRDVEYDMVRKDGTTLPVLLSASAITDSAGNYLMSRTTIYDIAARKQAENEIRMLARLQSVVADLGGQALGGATLAEMRDEASNQVARALNVDYCNILEFLPNREALLLVSGVGWKPGTLGHATVGLGTDSQAGYTLLSDQPVIVEDLRTEKRFSRAALLHEHQVVSGITVVVPTSAGPYGILGAHTRRRRDFTADEVNFLQAVANVLGSFIERQRAEARLWRLNQAQRALSRCNQVLVRATDEAALLQQICDVIVEEAGYRLCWVGRAEHDETKTVRPVAQAGYEAGYLATVNITWADSERGQGPTGTCIRTGETVLSRRIATDPKMMPWRAEALKRGYASSVAIPLVVDSTAFGALMIYAAEPDVFGSEEVDLLTELADDLAFGIAALRARSARARVEEEIRTLNAELEQRVNARTAELQAANKLKDELILREQAATASLARAREREVQIGFRIQQTLLLDQPPSDVPGLRVAALTVPSQRIDGDFYVFIKQQDQALDVIVGDVMGKGIPAALLGAATKSYFLKALGDLMTARRDHQLPEPKEVVMLAHAGVVRHLIELESFVTLCYLRLDVNRRRLDLVDCGHTGMLHLHGRTGACEIVHGDNLPMGVREGEIYDQVSLSIEPGDLLLLYSDGITEARNPAKELLGVERLKEFVTNNRHLEPSELVEALRKAVFTFSQSDRLADDLTSVAIKVEEIKFPLRRAETEIGSDLKQLRTARAFVRDFCGVSGLLDDDSVDALELAVNEAASNVMKHAYDGRTDQRIHLEAEAFPGRVSIRLRHLGKPFDPSDAAPPAFDGSRDCGFGAYIIMRCVDEVHYYRDERGRNCIALTKILKA